MARDDYDTLEKSRFLYDALYAGLQQRIDSRVRQACREKFREAKLLHRILPDIDRLLAIQADEFEMAGDLDADGALPEPLWEALLEDQGELPWSS